MVTTTRPGAAAISSVRLSPTSASEREMPSRMALVESPISARHALLAEARAARSSVGSLEERRRVELPVAGVQHGAERRADHQRSGSGIEWVMVTQLDIERPDLEAARRRATTVTGICGAPGSPRALASQQRGRERRRKDRHVQPRPEIEQRAEMILMGMGDDDAGEILALLLDKADVGQNQVDAGQMLVRGEGDAEIDRQPLPRVVGP